MNQPEPQYGQPAPPPYPARPVNPYEHGAPSPESYRQAYQAPAQPQGWQQQPPYPPAPQGWQQPGPPNQAWQQQPAAPQAPPAAPAWQQPAPPAAPSPAWQQPAPPNPAWQQPAAPAAPSPAWQQPAPPAAPNPAWQQPASYQPPAPAPQYQAPPAPAWQQQQPQAQAQPASFPPPPNHTPARDRLVEGAAPFLEPGETVYYGFILKLDDTIPETPRELMIAIEGQHRVLGGITRADKKMNKGLKWALNPMDAMNERIAERSVEALNRKLAGPVFVGGWDSQAGWFIRYSRATREDYGPGSWGVLTDRRYLIFRAGRAGGSSMRLVYGVPRTLIAGVRTEGTKDAALHGRTPRAELHFTDGSMVATMMPTKQGERVAAILAVQQQYQQPQYQNQYQNQNQNQQHPRY